MADSTHAGDVLGTHAVRAAAERAWRAHLGAGARLGGLAERLAAGSLAQAFHATAVAHPRRPALTIDGEHATHGELDVRAALLAGWLAATGVGDDDAVLVSGPPSLTLVVAYLAALRVGAVVALASPSAAAPELRRVAADAGIVAALASDGVLERLGPARPAIALSLDGGGAAPRVDDASAGASPRAPAARASGDVALLAWTSGTTGVPKVVPLTHGNVLASIRGAMLAWRWRDEDVLVHALPLAHQHGLSGVHATLLAGSRAVLASSFDARRLRETVARERATVLFAVPTIYERLLADEPHDPRAFATLRLATSGSAALPAGLARRAREALGVDPLERYGTTESGLNVSNLYDGPRRDGSVGLPLPGVELAIADRAGQPVTAGETGEIVVRGPQVFAGYRGVQSGAFWPGGWFRTGDLGHVAPDSGALTITGRAKELIVSGGLNVYPREVELALEADPSVRAAAVAGIPSRRWGEEVVALVVPARADGLDVAALQAATRERIAAYKCPKRLFAVAALPRTATGKLVRAKVAAIARDLADEETALDQRRAMLRAAAREVERAAAGPLDGDA